jgi:hypothetical protein
MATIVSTLQRIKLDLAQYLPESSILDAARQANHQWRQRRWGPVQTVQLFILQVLCFNTSITHLRLLARSKVNAAAYCRARMRLPLELLQTLLRQSSAAMRRQIGAAGHWCGLRAYLVDASSSIAPDTPDSQKQFPQPVGQKPGCGFPIPKILGLFDAYSGLITEAICLPLYTHDLSNCWRLHPRLGKGDVLVGDRGFCSYAHLCLLMVCQVAGLFRIHQAQNVSFRRHRRCGGKGRPTSRYVKRLGKHDQIVEWRKPGQSPRWMDRGEYDLLPKTLLVREIRYTLAKKGQRTQQVTIATTLLDPVLYPKEKIVELYEVRWTVETHFGELKTTLRMRKVKSETAAGVQKEIAVYCLVYNLVHMVMLAAAQRQGVQPHRISFIDTVRWLLSASPGDPLPDLIVNPRRKGRHEPRVVKDLNDTYPKMKCPRRQMKRHPNTWPGRAKAKPKRG